MLDSACASQIRLRLPSDDRDRTLEDVLEAVDDFGSASVGLVAWELLAREDTVGPIWQQAISQRLLRPTGATDLGEPTYQLTLVGRIRLRELRVRLASRRQAESAHGTRDP